MFIHSHPPVSVQPHAVELRYRMQQLQVAGASQVSAMLASLYVKSEAKSASQAESNWITESWQTHGFYLFTLFYTWNEPAAAICPLLWFLLAPKLHPIGYQNARRRGPRLPTRKPATWRHFWGPRNRLLYIRYKAFLSKLKRPTKYFNTKCNM